MGMYDTICGDQVKCFYKQFEHDGGLWTSGGSLNYYNIGDEVPYKTDYYDYTRNFNIINIWDESETEDNNILTGIRDGKVIFSKKLTEGVESDWTNMQKCISYYGEELKISAQDEALDYAKAVREYERQKFDYIKNKMPYRKKVSDILYGIALVDQTEKDRRNAEMNLLIEEKSKEMRLFMEFNHKLIKNLLSKYITDTDGNIDT